jgi:hypothetical protein
MIWQHSRTYVGFTPLTHMNQGLKSRFGRGRPKGSNTSGYLGVSWNKTAGKWHAFITVEKKRHYLGLYRAAEVVNDARKAAEIRLGSQKIPPNKTGIRQQLLKHVRQLYADHGIMAVSTPFLEKQRGKLYARLLAAGLYQPALLAELGLVEEYVDWRELNRNYRGVTKPRWTWEVALTNDGCRTEATRRGLADC